MSISALNALASFLTGSRRDLLVTDGRVNCPRSAHGDASVDRCYACPLLVGSRVDRLTGETHIHCRALDSSPVPMS